MCPYHDVLEYAGCKSIEATMRKLRLFWAGSVFRPAANRLYQRVIVGEMERPPSKEEEEERAAPRGREKQWTTCINNELKTVGAIDD